MSEKTLNDYCEFIVDCLHKTAPIEETETGFYSIRTPDIGRGRLNIEAANRVSEETYKKWTVRGVPQAGDLILAREAPVGNIGIVPKNVKVCCGQRTVHIRPNKSKIVPEYLVYLMNGDEIQGKIQGYSQGATVAHLNMEDIRALVLPELPPLPTQQHIADILSAYDDLIENNTRRIRILEQMAQAIYQEWFGKVDKESLPKGWELKPFGELLSFDVNGGWGEEKQSEQFPVPAYVIRGTDIPGGRYGQFDKVPFRYHKQSNFQSRQLLLGDIVIEIAGGSKGQPVGRALLIGKGILHKFDRQVICASFCKLVRPNQNIVSPEYLYMHLREIYENGQIEKYQTQSTGIINFKSSFFFEDNLVVVPNKELMDEFTEIIRPMFQMIETLGSKNANLRQTRDLLLPRLVSGEIEIQ